MILCVYWLLSFVTIYSHWLHMLRFFPEKHPKSEQNRCVLSKCPEFGTMSQKLGPVTTLACGVFAQSQKARLGMFHNVPGLSSKGSTDTCPQDPQSTMNSFIIPKLCTDKNRGSIFGHCPKARHGREGGGILKTNYGSLSVRNQGVFLKNNRK